MYKPIFYLLIILFLSKFTSNQLLAQGCSDAGFCTMSGLRPHSQKDTNTYKSWLKFGASFGIADYGIKVWGNYLEYAYKLSGKFNTNIKIISLGHSGNGINTWSVGDIILSGTYQIKSELSVSLGIKTPLTNGNTMYKKMPLPMDYQASLGTYDIILGFAYKYKKFSLNAGLQYPFIQNNNTFLKTENSNLSHISPTNNFMRSPDLLLRLSYPFNLGSKFVITPSILPIYHLYDDKYVDENHLINPIIGSGGLTLNLNLYLDYNINYRHKIQFSIGAPAIVRKARPDGLTRYFISNIEYGFAL